MLSNISTDNKFAWLRHSDNNTKLITVNSGAEMDQPLEKCSIIIITSKAFKITLLYTLQVFPHYSLCTADYTMSQQP